MPIGLLLKQQRQKKIIIKIPDGKAEHRLAGNLSYLNDT